MDIYSHTTGLCSVCFKQVAARIIEPRRLKKIMGAKDGKASWNKWGKTGFISPLIPWQNGYKSKNAELKQFCKKIGLTHISQLSDQSFGAYSSKINATTRKCELLKPDFSTTLLALTASYSQLINGGKSVQP